MEEGLLSLKWNNHKSTFFQILALLREKHTYTDVTLACDGRLYPVHKFILSTCSEYFSDIFNSNSGNNIVIVLKDVRRQDLEYLLDYMYLGQVDVAQSELSSLIKTAECLKIKGLAIPDDEPQTASRRVAEEREPDISPPSKKKRHHADDNRTIGASANSSNNISSRIQPILAIPPPSLPPHTMQQQALLQRLQVPVSQPQIPPTSQFGGKSHPSSMTHITSPRTVHVTTSSTHPSHAPPLSSPTQPSAMPVIKQEVTEPPEIDYGHENFEDAKPDVSESQHLDQDMAVAGPSGIQGSADNWDGESDLGGYAGGEAYSEGSLEETGVDSEAQGERRPSVAAAHRPQAEHSVEYRKSWQAVRSPSGSSPTGQAIFSPSSHFSDVTTGRPFQGSCGDAIGGTAVQGNALLYEGHVEGPPSVSPKRCMAVKLDQDFKMRASDTVSPGSSEPVLQKNEAAVLNALSMPADGFGSTSRDPLQCPWCDKVLSKPSNLKVHMRRHTGEKPYQCLFCPYSAAQKVQVLNHMNTRHHQASPNTFQ